MYTATCHSEAPDLGLASFPDDGMLDYQNRDHDTPYCFQQYPFTPWNRLPILVVSYLRIDG